MPDRLPISVLLLARDEGAALEALLPALGFAREVVVVWDPRGTPQTRAAAARLGARVLERPFDGFGPQRAFALAQCSEPWVLWIDADERLVADPAGLAEAVRPGGDVTHWSVLRVGYFLGRRIRWCGWRDERIVRLFRRDAARFDDAPVHERVHVSGRGARLAATLEHHSYVDWRACTEKLQRYAEAGAERAWRAGRRASALDVAVRPPLRFLRMYVLQAGFLDGGHGLALCGLAAAQVFLKYAALWARSRAPGDGAA